MSRASPEPRRTRSLSRLRGILHQVRCVLHHCGRVDTGHVAPASRLAPLIRCGLASCARCDAGLARSSLIPRHMSCGDARASVRRPLWKQERVGDQLRVVAKLSRFRVQPAAEEFTIIPDRYSQIERNGVNRYSCACQASSPSPPTPTVPACSKKLWAIVGVKRYQTGDIELRALFPLKALDR